VRPFGTNNITGFTHQVAAVAVGVYQVYSVVALDRLVAGVKYDQLNSNQWMLSSLQGGAIECRESQSYMVDKAQLA